MNTMKIIAIIFFICCLSIGCNYQRDPKYYSLSDGIVSQYLKDMKKKYGLSCFGCGGGFLEKVNEISISFDKVGPKNKEELRELLVIVTEDLLDRYNRDEEIRPYLKNYPFTPENLRIGITVVDRKGIGIHNPGGSREHLYAVYQSSGQVRYVIENDEKLALQVVFRESYEDALNIVKNQKKDNVLN